MNRDHVWGGQFVYARARAEYAWLLRADGMKLRDIGDRFGISPERARQIIARYGRQMSFAMRKARWTMD